MRERPIILTADEVRAVLEGRFPGPQADGGWEIRNIFNNLIGEGETLRAAIDDAMRKEGGDA